MLRHHHVPNHLELVLPPDLFKDLQEQVPARNGTKERSSLVTTTSDVMEIATSIPAAQSFGHGKKFYMTLKMSVGDFVNPPFAAAVIE
jgi:hypothetical protein